LFTEVLDGRNAQPAGGVRDALGREAEDFAAYAARAAAAGAWSLPAVTR
ncbi:MAG: NmrA family transcriptional regulator, partial [Thermoleophilia bacterium]|nr:NmrA family transcriptional regulator [Thermoleophilia bacterium]